jgi:hypothetical protein
MLYRNYTFVGGQYCNRTERQLVFDSSSLLHARQTRKSVIPNRINDQKISQRTRYSDCHSISFGVYLMAVVT